MLIYLAGPIDAVDLATEARPWRERAAHQLAQLGIATFSPAHAFTVPPTTGSLTALSILRINEEALRASDGVIACLNGQTFGTPIECHEAWATQKPVVCFGGSSRSLYRFRFEQAIGVDEALQVVSRWQREASEPPVTLVADA